MLGTKILILKVKHAPIEITSMPSRFPEEVANRDNFRVVLVDLIKLVLKLAKLLSRQTEGPENRIGRHDGWEIKARVGFE